MAKYVPSGIGVGELRNKAGSNVFSRNRFGTYIRNKANPVQPRTTFQLDVRETFVALSKAWRSLTDAQRLDWSNLGAQIQRLDALNQVYTLTGLQAYILVNMRRILAGLSPITDAPLKDNVTDLTSLTATLTPGPLPTVEVAFTPAIGANERVVVYAAGPMSQGIHFLGRPIFRQIFVSAAGASSPLNVSAQYLARFPFPNVGQRVAFMAEVWSQNFIPGNQIKTTLVRT
jgi:hypothetical protein